MDAGQAYRRNKTFNPDQETQLDLILHPKTMKHVSEEVMLFPILIESHS